MVLSLTVTGVALFYLGAIPICFAFHLRWNDAPEIGTGLALFEARFAMRRAQRLFSPSLSGASPKPKDRTLRIRAGLRAARSLLSHLPPNGACLFGTLGTSDAALTATLCGSVNALGGALNASTNRRVALSLQPDFSANRFCIEASGMISTRAGHIMLAAFLGALEYETGRFRSWISTPLKA